MYNLIRSALRSRPHGVVIGEARGAEAWELIRAAAPPPDATSGYVLLRWIRDRVR